VASGDAGYWVEGLRIHDLRHTAVALWIAAGADVELVLGALEDAVWGRGIDGDPGQRRLIHHSDRGSQPSTPPSGSPSALPTLGSSPRGQRGRQLR
jgi:transposase InsO family protein